MIPSKTLIATLLFATAASAQTIVKSALSTHSNYGNFAVQGKVVSFRSIKAGTPLRPGTSITVGARTPSGGVDTIVSWRQRGNVVSADVSEQGAVSVSKTQPPFRGGSTPSAPGGRFAPGAHSLMLQIGGKPGQTGLVEMWATGATDRGAGVKYAIDVNNDNRVDFAWGSGSDFTTKLMRVVIPRSGRLMIRITSATSVAQAAGGSLRYKTGASVRFTPGPHCAALPFGRSCGPRLAGKFSGGGTSRTTKFELHYHGSKNSNGLIIFGTKFSRIPVFGSKCVLLTDPRVVAPFKTDAMGNKVWGFAFQTGSAVDVKIQGLDFGNGRSINLSNGLHALCVK